MGVRVRKWKGTYWLFIAHQGRRRARRVGDKKAAELAATKIRARLAEGDAAILDPISEISRPTFAQYSERWVLETIAPHRKPRTEEFYRRVLALHLVPVLGRLLLSEITREQVRALIASKSASGLSRLTVRNIVATLRAVLNQAVEDGALAVNPAIRFGRHLQHRHDPRARVTALTEGEVALVIDAADRLYRDYAELVALLFFTGLREGEALGLQWGDLDAAGGFLEVRRTVDVRPGRFLIGTPKSGKARRVDVPDSLMRALVAAKSLREAEAAVDGYVPSPWLFPALTDRSKPLNASWLRRHVWYPLLAKAGLRRIRVHDARHTYASLLLQAGEPIAYVKDQLGHSSIQVTVDVYGHLIPGANRGEVNRLARAVDDAKVRETATPAQPAVQADGEVVAEVLKKNGAPGVTRTPGTQFRKLLLYPPELRGRLNLRDALRSLPRFVLNLVRNGKAPRNGPAVANGHHRSATEPSL
jgi:integrase